MSISVGASSIVHRGILTPSPTVPLVPFPSCVRRGSVQESSYPSSGQLPVPAPSIHVSTWIRDGFLHVRSLCLSCALTGSSRGEMKASPLIISDGTWFWFAGVWCRWHLACRSVDVWLNSNACSCMYRMDEFLFQSVIPLLLQIRIGCLPWHQLSKPVQNQVNIFGSNSILNFLFWLPCRPVMPKTHWCD